MDNLRNELKKEISEHEELNTFIKLEDTTIDFNNIEFKNCILKKNLLKIL